MLFLNGANVNICCCNPKHRVKCFKWDTLFKHTVHLQRILFSLQWFSLIGMKEGRKSVLNPKNFSLSTSGWCGSYWLGFILVVDYMVEMLEIVCWNWLNTVQMYWETLSMFIQVSDNSVFEVHETYYLNEKRFANIHCTD